MSGIVADISNSDLIRSMGIELGEDGFANSLNPFEGNVESGAAGIFIAGAVSGPKTIPEAINDARGCAISIYKYLKER